MINLNLIAYDSVYVYAPSSEVFQRSNLEHTAQKVEFTLHENGFKIKSEQWGALTLFFKDLERVELIRKVQWNWYNFIKTPLSRSTDQQLSFISKRSASLVQSVLTRFICSSLGMLLQMSLWNWILFSMGRYFRYFYINKFSIEYSI